MLKSKIHGAVITSKDLRYNGSIGIDKAMLFKSDILAGEKVQVLNFNNGQRFEIYIIEEEENLGIICLYGLAACLGEVGDKSCVILYALVSGDDILALKPVIVMIDDKNKVMQ